MESGSIVKTGDKVWIMYAEKIIQVEYVEFLGKPMLWEPGSYPTNAWDAKKKPYFPTKKALCEHYLDFFTEEMKKENE